MNVRKIEGKNIAELESYYWIWFVILSAASVLMLVSFLLEWVLGFFGVGQGLGAFVTFIVLGFGAVLWLPASVGALIGYYKECKALKKVGSMWTPHWTSYLFLHFIFSPFIAAPLYLTLRTAALGRPSKVQYVRTELES